ncbi:MAG: DUF4389 domain-containing protein [Acidimicrobiia bacterium]|nr:DUF4389 domain-containing protein [Acidimicrobiia bacterium]
MSVVIEPVEVNADYPERIANWRPLVSWLLVIPQMFVAAILGWLFGILAIVAFFTVLFTKKIPRGVFDFMVMTLRYSWRTNTYAMFMREGYPPFDFTAASAADDPSVPADPAHLGIDYPEELNRWLPLVKWFLAIPHYIALFFLGIAGFFVWIFSAFAVLFTGKYPEGAFKFMVGIHRWATRVQSYVGLMRDEYPPFMLD